MPLYTVRMYTEIEAATAEEAMLAAFAQIARGETAMVGVEVERVGTLQAGKWQRLEADNAHLRLECERMYRVLNGVECCESAPTSEPRS